jgi:putative membrane protein
VSSAERHLTELFMAYLWLKAFHIVGVVAWFAGLFYLVRIFIYHVEAEERPEQERAVLQPQYALMERRLFVIITRPAMLVTLATAAGLLLLQPSWLRDWWLWAKTAMVGGLVLTTCSAADHEPPAAGGGGWTGNTWGAHRGAHASLIVVAPPVVFKNQPPLGTALVVLATGALFAIAIRLYARAGRAEAGPCDAAHGEREFAMTS